MDEALRWKAGRTTRPRLYVVHPLLIQAELTEDSEFTQLIKGYQGERLRQAFHFFDQDGDGYINPDEFQKIIVVRGAAKRKGDAAEGCRKWPDTSCPTRCLIDYRL